ncbi:MAG: CPBP family glutamic-type intramembrane protease [Anaerolineales bacterium]
MKTLPRFLWLVLLFSIPLWLAASFFDATKIIPVKLPFSALQFLSVLFAAVITTRQSGASIRRLLLRGIDIKNIQSPIWQVGIFLLMPLTVLLSYFLILWSGATIPDKMTPLSSIPVFLLVYGISGYCEEIGWTALMTDILLERRAVILCGLIVGITGALWHIIPFIQTHNTLPWIFWQCMYSIIYRVLLIKIYILANRSVFSTIAAHATYNAAFSLMPYYGSSYNPMFMSFTTLFITVIIFTLFKSPRYDYYAHS